MANREQIEQAIAAQESLRGTLPDGVIDTTIAALRAQLTQQDEGARRRRRQVTVLFADVKGFSAMASALDAEDVTETVDALWLRLDKIVVDHGGMIDKHIGDAVMALWGGHQAGEDDPEQAVRCALAMQEAMITFCASCEANLRMRIGIHTGPAVVGEVGTTGEVTAMGDTVNVADHLEEAAPVGGVLISHETYRHVRGIFEVQARPLLRVKGRNEPMPVYVVQRPKPRAFRMFTRGVEGLETRMVGRDTELRELQRTYQTTMTDHRTTLVTVIGEAGVGKSRLLDEFQQWVDLLPHDTWYFKGRSDRHTSGIANFLLRDLFAYRFQIQESDAIETVRQKVERGVAQFLGAGSEVQAHFLGAWIGYDFSHSPHLAAIGHDAEQLHKRSLHYLGQFFTTAAATDPVVIFLEDAHWADAGSLDAVLDLMRRCADLQLLAVVLTQPDLLERWPGWAQGQPRLYVQPLASAAIRQLASDLLYRIDAIPEVLLDLLVNRVDGNPYYLEELVKVLIDDGVIVADGDRWYVEPQRLVRSRIPSTLAGVLQARLDKLRPEELALLQRAAVIGRVFWDAAVQRLAAEGRAVDFAPLLAKDLVWRRADTAFAGTDEYMFIHDLLYEAAYESILKRDRRRYHGLVADWLVEVTEVNGRTDEYAAVIAEHYERAGVLDRAQLWYGRAGQQAAARFSHEDALRWLGRALELASAGDVAGRYRLLLTRERVYDVQGNRSAQVADLQGLAELAEALGAAARATVALRQTNYYEAVSDYPAAIAAAQAAIAAAQEAGATELEAEGFWNWGRVLWHRGEYGTASNKLACALDLARATARPILEANALRILGVVAHDQGLYPQAQSFYLQALAICRHLGDPYSERRALINLGVLARDQGRLSAAHEYCAESIQIARQIGDRQGEGLTLINLAIIARDQGNFAQAEARFHESLAIARAVGHRQGEAMGLNYLGGGAHAQRQQEAAQQYYRQALPILREIGNRRFEAYALSGLGDALADAGQIDAAIDAYRQAIELRQRLGQRDLVLESRAGLARVALAQGELTQAMDAVNEILEFLEAGNTLDGAEEPLRILLTCYRVLAAASDGRARPVLGMTYMLLEKRMQAMPDEAARVSFREQIPWNREILAEWEAAVISP
jgi:class 3 adenylate cyclase/tetratricopeptide (TPR) repeat protein